MPLTSTEPSSAIWRVAAEAVEPPVVPDSWALAVCVASPCSARGPGTGRPAANELHVMEHEVVREVQIGPGNGAERRAWAAVLLCKGAAQQLKSSTRGAMPAILGV